MTLLTLSCRSVVSPYRIQPDKYFISYINFWKVQFMCHSQEGLDDSQGRRLLKVSGWCLLDIWQLGTLHHYNSYFQIVLLVQGYMRKKLISSFEHCWEPCSISFKEICIMANMPLNKLLRIRLVTKLIKNNKVHYVENIKILPPPPLASTGIPPKVCCEILKIMLKPCFF